VSGALHLKGGQRHNKRIARVRSDTMNKVKRKNRLLKKREGHNEHIGGQGRTMVDDYGKKGKFSIGKQRTFKKQPSYYQGKGGKESQCAQKLHE